jgi:hypothetical protein
VRLASQPGLELPLLRVRPFALANGSMLLFYAGFGAMLLDSVLLLTGPWGESIVMAGLMISVGPLTVAVVSVQVRRLVPRFGARLVATVGCLLLAAGGAWWRCGSTARPRTSRPAGSPATGSRPASAC